MRNISAKTDNVGDTLPASDFNANLRSELQNVVTSSDQTLDAEGGPDTDVEMLGKAITIYANASQYYQDSGAANAYVLARVGNLKPIVDYIDGVTVMFKAGNSNTGASTINVDSLGAKALRDNTDTALVGGEIIADGYVVARYNSSNDRFEILFSNSTKDLPVPASGDELQSIQVNAAGDGYELCGPLVNFKNKIINGNFDLWDYATSQTTNDYGSDNRWLNAHTGSSTKTHSQQSFTLGQTDVPGEPSYFSRTIVVTGSGAGDTVTKQQRIESVRTFAGKTITVSFWAKADSSKDIATEFTQFFDAAGGGSAAVDSIGITTHSLTSSWAKYTAIIDVPSISGKTIGSNGTDYIQIIFWFDAGSTFDARTNSLGNQSGTFDIAQVQIEEGPVATQFDDRNAIEIILAERFYWTGYAPGTATGQFYSTAGTTRFGAQVCFPSTMRTTPTVTASGGTYNNCSLDTIVATPTGFSEIVTVTATGLYRVRNNIYYADAEL